MNKKILAISLAACLLVALGAGLTLAYLTNQDSATNTFTVGNVEIDLTEPAWDETGEEDASEVYPGEPLAKDPIVTNTGANPCLVRVKISWPIEGMIYRTDYVDGKLGDDWKYNEADQFFYYLKPLEVDDATTKLFEQIVIPTSLTNGNALTEYNVVVTAYAVQAQGVFPSYSTVSDGISDAELPTVASFFNTAFAS